MVNSLQAAPSNYQVEAESYLNKDFNLDDNYLAKSIRLIKNFSTCWKAQQTPELAKAYPGIIKLADKVKAAHTTYKRPDMLAPSPSGSSRSSPPEAPCSVSEIRRCETTTGFLRYGAIYLHWLKLGLHERNDLRVAIAGPGIFKVDTANVSPQVYETARLLNGAAIKVLDISTEVLGLIGSAPPADYSRIIRKFPESNPNLYLDPQTDKMLTLLSAPDSREHSLEYQQFDFVKDQFAQDERFDLIVATSSLCYALAGRLQQFERDISSSPSEFFSEAITLEYMDQQYGLIAKFLSHLNHNGVLYLEQKTMQCLHGRRPQERLDSITSLLESQLSGRRIKITHLPALYGNAVKEISELIIFNDVYESGRIFGVSTHDVYAITVTHHACRGS